MSYEAKQGRAGMMYIRHPDDTFALLDRGDRVTVAHVDTDTVRAALALAASKWEKLELTGDVEFQRQAVRQAVRMGLGQRLGGLTPELDAMRLAEESWVATERAKQPAAEPAPVADAPAPSSQPASSPLSMAPVAASRRRHPN